jgi:hypothetical protein
MPITKEPVTDERGNLKWHYTWDGTGEPEGAGVLATGGVSGPVRLADGTVYDVTDDYIQHAPGHAGPISHHIALKHEQRALDPGDPNPPLGNDYRHECTADCAGEARPTA